MLRGGDWGRKETFRTILRYPSLTSEFNQKEERMVRVGSEGAITRRGPRRRPLLMWEKDQRTAKPGPGEEGRN